MDIILATTSKHRVEVMKNTGIPFRAMASGVEEYFEGRPETPYKLVKYLSALKAEAVSKKCIDSLVIGLDTVSYFNGKILEKPKSYEEGFDRLRMFSGNFHELYTGITVINTKTDERYQESVLTKIKLRDITEDEIRDYLNQDKNYKTYALGYNPLTFFSSTFIERIEGDPFNVLAGLPLAVIVQMINKAQE